MRDTMKIVMLFLAAVLVLSACGNSSKNADNPKREDATIMYENEKEGGTMNTGGGYGFNKFDLEIDVDGKDVIDVEYEVAKNHRAKYVNKLAGLNLKAQEAFNELDPLFVKFATKKSLSEKDVKENIMEWFGVDTYTKFDLEIDFDDGTKMVIEDHK
ncbi:YusW family protein [Sporosarcina koreensis]|uniref:YusW family protein n=1 Tax=Sporosarcina koreensis TaxID=334735 RepID=A0ABW0U2W3_9BACL